MSACTHHLGVPGQPCPFCLQIVPEGVAEPPARASHPSGTTSAAEVAPRREGGVRAVRHASTAPAAPTAAPTPTVGCPPRLDGPAQSATAQHGSGQLDLFATATDGPDDGIGTAVPAAGLVAVADIPRARTTDPATAHQAANRTRAKAAADRELVLGVHANAGTTGLTGEELAAATGRPYSSIGPRRPALEEAGLIAKARDDAGWLVRRWNSRGNLEQVYAITEAGAAEAATLDRHAGAA